MKIEYHTGLEGEFETEVPLYTDCPGLPELVLKIKGKVLSKPEQPSL